MIDTGRERVAPVAAIGRPPTYLDSRCLRETDAVPAAVLRLNHDRLARIRTTLPA